MEINKIQPSKNKFTETLVNIPDAPKTLYFKGQLPKKRIKTVAIVGTRKPTVYGKEVTTRLAGELARNGIIVVSGMALGIDGVAHRAALDAGGITLAVLANGVDTFYPRSNTNLGQKIIEKGGAVISEYKPGTPALPHQFLARNRIVSGLADVVVVVEAAIRSGTLSTANHALNQGKDVFAVPGNITSPLSAGCNKLIKMGAQPLTDINELIDFLLPKNRQTNFSEILVSSPEEAKILEIIKSGIRDGDEIFKTSGLSISSYNQAMTMLEIGDHIQPLGANRWSLK